MQLCQIHKCYCCNFAKTDQNEFMYQASKGLTRPDCISRLKSNQEVYDNHSNLHNCHAKVIFVFSGNCSPFIKIVTTSSNKDLLYPRLIHFLYDFLNLPESCNLYIFKHLNSSSFPLMCRSFSRFPS